MMRTRGAIVLAAGLPFWIYLIRFITEVRKSAFGYELGSVAFPLPTQFRVARGVAMISLLLGLYLLVTDFIKWIKKSPTEPSRPTR
jgi:hypothetical protein